MLHFGSVRNQSNGLIFLEMLRLKLDSSDTLLRKKKTHLVVLKGTEGRSLSISTIQTHRSHSHRFCSSTSIFVGFIFSSSSQKSTTKNNTPNLGKSTEKSVQAFGIDSNNVFGFWDWVPWFCVLISWMASSMSRISMVRNLGCLWF